MSENDNAQRPLSDDGLGDPLNFARDGASTELESGVLAGSSLISQGLQKSFQRSLLVLLVINGAWYLLSSLISLGTVNMTGIDFALILFGYYAQDVFRSKALKLYWQLTFFVVFVDLAVIIARATYLINVGSAGLAVLDVLIFVLEVAVKLWSAVGARALHRHLDSLSSGGIAVSYM